MLKSVIVNLFMPPFGFATLAVAGLLLARVRPRLGLRVVMIALLGLIVLAMPAVSDQILLALETDLPRTPSPDSPPAAIVVLGAEFRRTSDEPAIIVGPLSLERLRTAADLQRRTGLPIMVSGGTIQTGVPPVGTVMADSLIEDFKVPVRWREIRSLDTWENAQFSAEMLRAEGITSIYVVTHAWHMRRALQAFRPTGLTVVAAPTPPHAPIQSRPQDFLPHASSWEVSYFAIHEWIGRVWYALR